MGLSVCSAIVPLPSHCNCPVQLGSRETHLTLLLTLALQALMQEVQSLRESRSHADEEIHRLEDEVAPARPACPP